MNDAHLGENSCGDKTTLTIPAGAVAASMDLRCTKWDNHSGRHSVSRWFGGVFLIAEW